MQINFKDPFIFAGEVKGINLFYCQLFLKAFVNNLENACGRNYKKVLATFHKYHMEYFLGKKDSRELAEYVVQKIVNNPSYGDEINEETRIISDRVENYSKKISEMNLKELSDEEFFGIIEKYVKLHSKVYEYGVLGTVSDMYYPAFTKYLTRLVKKRIPEGDENRILLVLTTPNEKSRAAEEQEKLLKIIDKIKKDKDILQLFKNEETEEIKKNMKPEIGKEIEEYWENYKAIRAGWIGEAPPIDELYRELTKMIKTNLPIQKAKKYDSIEKEKLLEKFTENEKKLFEIYSGFMLMKVYRRYAQLKSAYYANSSLIKEYCRRTGLSRFEAGQLLVEEMREILLNKKFPEDFAERKSGFIYYGEKGEKAIISKKEEVEEIEKRISEMEKTAASEIEGVVASVGSVEKGVIKGRVKIVDTVEDMKRFSKGDILVSIATKPQFVPIMKKAGAIITDQGGVTSHAALVSRELGIPCIIGTKIATKALKDGDEVEVDIRKGIVRKM